MLHPTTIEQKLGFDSVKDWIRDYCQFKSGRLQVDSIRFSSNPDHIRKLLTQTAEMKMLLGISGIPSPRSVDSQVFLEHIDVEESYLDSDELLDVANALQSASEISVNLKGTEDIIALKSLCDLVSFDVKRVESILDIFDKNGKLKDSASPELKKIRRDINRALIHVRKSMDKVFKQAKKSGYVLENSGPTLRNGRMVIPVRASHKRKISGFIHDHSSTGQTLYVEPSEVLEANNDIIELGYAEKREVIKILKIFTNYIRQDLTAVKQAFRFLSLIDFLYAKARVAQDINAEMPEIGPGGGMELINAYHPILVHSNKKGRKVVPLNISLTYKERIILISGPNAGGKSVCLKTVGLIQYMFQSGLLIPVDPDSKLGIVKDIFIDLGDEQSLENDLSTYSSHLTNMQRFLTKSSKYSLVLIDEFGTGTDPQFGGSIAEAILEKLLQTGCFGIITTHYGNLKEFATKNKGVQNAAMQFDMDKLEPLYTLEPGRPGSSFALEVAKKIGLGKDIIMRAQELAGSDSVQVETLIQRLTQEKRIASEKLRAIEKKEIDLESKISRYNKLSDELHEQTSEIIDKARREANSLLENTNRNIEKTIRHIRENKAQKSETRKARESLSKFKRRIKPPKERKQSDNKLVYIDGPIRKGDFVQVNESEMIGEVITIKAKTAKVLIGDLQTNAKISELRRIKPGPVKQFTKSSASKFLDIASKQKEFSPDIDVRGKRAEEIAPIMDQFIDDALLLGYQKLRILHGKGDGILREVVRTYLTSFSEIKNLEDEHVERGGAGITLVTLK